MLFPHILVAPVESFSDSIEAAESPDAQIYAIIVGLTTGLVFVFIVALDAVSLPVYIAYMKFNLGQGLVNPFQASANGPAPVTSQPAGVLPQVGAAQGVAAMVQGSVMATTQVSQVRFFIFGQFKYSTQIQTYN